jgi:ACS family glucarate transporter-like MFS transporter
MTRNWFPPASAARVMGVVNGASALGAAVSPILFAALIARFGWRRSFWIAAVITGAVYLLWHAWARDYPAGKAPRPHIHAPGRFAAWGRLLRDRNMVLLTLSYFCLNYFEYIFFYWTYYYFGEIRHLGQRQSAAAVTVLMLTMMVMTPLGGWISDGLVSRYGVKKGRRIVPFFGMTLSAVLLYAGAGGFGVVATVALLSLAFGFSATAEGPCWAAAIDVGGSQSGAAGGIMNTGGNAGGLLAPTITPLLASHFGWAWGLYFGSFVVMLGVVAWFFIDAGHTRCEA